MNMMTKVKIPLSLSSTRVSPQTDSTGRSLCIPCGHPYMIASLVAVYVSLHLNNTSLSEPVGATQQIVWLQPIRLP